MDQTSVIQAGRFPKRWRPTRLREFLVPSKQRNGPTPYESMLSVSEYDGVKPKTYSDENQMRSSDDLELYRVVHKNDVVLNTMWLDRRGLGVSNHEGHVSPAYRVLRVRTNVAHPSFVHALLRSDIYVAEYTRLIYGIRPNSRVVSDEDFLRIPAYLPELREQEALGRFLDRETTRIDFLVAKKERLLELLEEKRKTLIAHAVTNGLRKAKSKATGSEDFANIPSHWDFKPVKHVFRFLDGRRIPLSSEERANMARTYPYYGASGIIDAVDNFIFDEPLVLLGEDGANLVLRSTPLAFVARGKYWVNNHAHILKPRDGRVDFWAQVLNAVDYYPFISGSAQPKLTLEALGSIKIPVPPEDERDTIWQWIFEKGQAIDAVRQYQERSVALLRERRQALTTAVVTGQVDPMMSMLGEVVTT